MLKLLQEFMRDFKTEFKKEIKEEIMNEVNKNMASKQDLEDLRQNMASKEDLKDLKESIERTWESNFHLLILSEAEALLAQRIKQEHLTEGRESGS